VSVVEVGHPEGHDLWPLPRVAAWRCRRSGYSVIRPLFLPVYVRGGVSEKVGLRGESR